MPSRYSYFFLFLVCWLSVEAAPLDKITRRLTVSGIPVLERYINDEKPKQLIIVAHGFGQSKELVYNPMIAPLVEKGYMVVGFDAYAHGKRGTPRKLTAVANSYPTVDDFRKLTSHYRTDSRVIGKPLIVGVSMGGVATHIFLSEGGGKDISGAVIMLGTPNPQSILLSKHLLTRLTSLGEGKVGIATKGVIEKSEEMIIENNPIRTVEPYIGTPLLMLNGGNDGAIPLMDVRQLQLYLEEHSSGTSQLVIDPTGGHEFTALFEKHFFSWIDANFPID